jgi:hypothetical protein
MITIKRKKWYAAAVSAAILTATPLLITSTAQAQTDQGGEVHSCTTNGDAGVFTTNGGYTWVYAGSGGGNEAYPKQFGVVHSYNTGGNANVYSPDGGLIWYFVTGNPLLCSPP